MQIEFEKKFVLDLDAQQTILERIYSKRYGVPEIDYIWQCYGAKKDNRFRAAINNRTGVISAIKEVKKSIKVPVHYSVNMESDDETITPSSFMRKFARSNKRLCKIRWTLRGSAMMDSTFPVDHKLMVDLFVPVPPRLATVPFCFDHLKPYALIAETETILGVNTTALNLDFQLPAFLAPYCIKAVDKRDNDKAFTAYSLCYTPDVAEFTRELVRSLKNG